MERRSHGSRMPVWRARSAIALGGVSLVLTLMPAAAAAGAVRKGTGLTKAQVITLIKKYSKPGPRGLVGPPGMRGASGETYTVNGGSGLALSGSALSIASGLLGSCPGYEFLFGLSTEAQGSQQCSYPGEVHLGTGGFVNSSSILGSVMLGTSYTTVAHTDAFGSVSPATYYVHADVELTDLSDAGPDLYSCQLADGMTVLQTDAQSVSQGDYMNVGLQATIVANVGDTLSVNCKVTDGASGNAQGSIAATPISG